MRSTPSALLLLSPRPRAQGPQPRRLYLFADGSWVLENFNDQPVRADLDGESIDIPARRLEVPLEVIAHFPSTRSYTRT